MKPAQAETRRRILDAAASAMIDMGLPGTTTKEVAHRAELAEGTIYLYFDSKRTLFAAVLQERLLLPSMALFPDAAGRPAITVLTELVRSMIERLDRMIPLMAALMADPELVEAVRSRPPHDGRFVGIDQLTSFLSERQATGEVREGDPRMLARMIFATPFHHVFLARSFGEALLAPHGDAFVTGLVEAVVRPAD